MTKFPIHVHLGDGREFLVTELDPVMASVKVGGKWLQEREIVQPIIVGLLTSTCQSGDTFVCDKCGVRHAYRGWVTGYGTNSAGEKICYECCREFDKEWMSENDKITLYLTQATTGRWRVTNWPGTLRFRVDETRKGKHNITGTRYDVWFTDREGNRWWGVSYGENSQLCHCRKLKGSG